MVTFGTCVVVRCLDRLSVLMLWCLLRLGDCLLCRGSGEVFAPHCFLFPQLFDHGLSGRSRGVRHSGGRSELVDTATARRQQRVEDATRAGLQFPFRPERRGRGVPIVAMNWRDAVKAAIMRGPFATGCHSRCAVLVAT